MDQTKDLEIYPSADGYFQVPEFDEYYSLQIAPSRDGEESQQMVVLCELIEREYQEVIAFGRARLFGNKYFNETLGRTISLGNAMKYLFLKFQNPPKIVNKIPHAFRKPKVDKAVHNRNSVEESGDIQQEP